MTGSRRRPAVLLGAVLLAAAPVVAGAAADKPATGVVVAVEGRDLLLSLGTADGLSEAARVQLLRRLVVTNPVTGKEVVDHVPIGTAHVAVLGRRLSIVRGWESLPRAPQPADLAVWVPPPPPTTPAAPLTREAAARRAETLLAKQTRAREREAATQHRAQRIAENEALRRHRDAAARTFGATIGAALDDRIAAFEAFLAAAPDSPHAPAVSNEIGHLRWLSRMRDEARAQAAPPAPPTSLGPSFDPPALAEAGHPVVLRIALEHADRVEAVTLWARAPGQQAYQSLAMRPDGDFTYAGQLPEALTAQAGTVEYAIDAVRKSGVLEPLAGSGSQPLQLTLHAPPKPPAVSSGLSRARATFESVDFDTGGELDHYTLGEVDFRYRMRHTGPLVAVRVGVGVLQGNGGTTAVVAAGDAASAKEIGLTYGFAELELEAHEWFGGSARVIGGSHHGVTPAGRRASPSEEVAGVAAALRIGRMEGTRLRLGVSALEDVGNQAIVEMIVAAFPRIPASARVVVTNLPVAEALGVRITAQTGYQVYDWLAVSVIGGWNLRTITQQGVTLGGGLTFDW